jgi:hypothetical protein
MCKPLGKATRFDQDLRIPSHEICATAAVFPGEKGVGASLRSGRCTAEGR